MAESFSFKTVASSDSISTVVAFILSEAVKDPSTFTVWESIKASFPISAPFELTMCADEKSTWMRRLLLPVSSGSIERLKVPVSFFMSNTMPTLGSGPGTLKPDCSSLPLFVGVFTAPPPQEVQMIAVPKIAIILWLFIQELLY